MKLKSLLILLILFQFSCKDKREKQVETWNKRVQEITIQTKKSNVFDFQKFIISKGKIGEIKIGMRISDAEKFINQLTKTKAEAYDFGFDGGGFAYIYSLKNEPVIALIPKRDSDEILAITALSKNLKMNNGLHPESTVAEIQQKYPDIKINQDIMMDWEFMQDPKNNLQFIFMTNENNQIGEYSELEIPSEPKRIDIKTDWIEIR
ncbi:hypothetical protein [Flavobacterium sp. 3-210]